MEAAIVSLFTPLLLLGMPICMVAIGMRTEHRGADMLLRFLTLQLWNFAFIIASALTFGEPSLSDAVVAAVFLAALFCLPELLLGLYRLITLPFIRRPFPRLRQRLVSVLLRVLCYAVCYAGVIGCISLFCPEGKSVQSICSYNFYTLLGCSVILVLPELAAGLRKLTGLSAARS